jgi:acylphosphatase
MPVKHLRIHGLVQGVGFRWSFSRQAQHLGVRGWVRNCRDGTVEAVVAGDAAQVEDMIRWAHRGPAGSHVTNVEVADGEGEFSHFEQRPTV